MTKLSKSNESALGSAIDLFNDLKSIATKPDKAAELISRHRKNTNPYIRSISSASQDLICAFPVISSRNISMDAQILVSKAIEKNCVSMLQMIFAANQVYDANDVDGIRDILSKYHVNLSKNATAVDMDDIVRLISNESGSISDMGFISNPSMIHECTSIPYSVSYEAKKQLNNLNEVLGPDVNAKSINESYSCVTDSQGKFRVSTQPRRSSLKTLKISLLRIISTRVFLVMVMLLRVLRIRRICSLSRFCRLNIRRLMSLLRP